MKKLVVLATTLSIILLGFGSAFAANSLQQGKIALGVGIGSDDYIINGRYLATKDLAIIAGIGFTTTDADAGDATSFGIIGGVRKYLNTTDFAPFSVGRYRSDRKKRPVAQIQPLLLLRLSSVQNISLALSSAWKAQSDSDL